MNSSVACANCSAGHQLLPHPEVRERLAVGGLVGYLLRVDDSGRENDVEHR